MPASVANAAPSTVLPNGLCRAFSRSHEYGLDWNEWQDNRCAIRPRTVTSRKRWTTSRIMTAAEVATLRTFFNNRNGGMEPFYFYDLMDDPGAIHDPTGVLTRARYIVRFEGLLRTTHPIGRAAADFALVELG